ncbi:MAG: protein arginine kinase [Bacilli bacterium]
MSERVDGGIRKWLHKEGPQDDIVWRTRVRLARNVANFKFPPLLERAEEKVLVEQIKMTLPTVNEKLEQPLHFVTLDDITRAERTSLVEKHLISPDFAKKESPKLLLASKDEKVSIMVNEEDHMRIQCLFTGLQLENAFKLANEVDDAFEEELTFSFHRSLGYLTSCPTNLGTALRASALVHLPALLLTGQLPILLETMERFGVVLRGFYGEGTESMGQLFQVSNQLTLGRTEQETIELMGTIIEQLCEQERASREKMWKRDRYELEDRVFRSLGILQYSRKISIKEALQCMTYLQIGNYLNIITNISHQELMTLMIAVQPGHLQLKVGKVLTSEEQEIERARLIRNTLQNRKAI